MNNQSSDTRDILAAIHAAKASSEGRMDKLERTVAGLARGFPDGDPESHRRYHESIIEWRELRNQMVRDALTHAAKVGGIGAVCWVAYAIWVVLKMEFQK
ncbi:hypothetical protein H0A64_07190 [Alcaligenaceae bacterium]|nr:hypothetical protein [Alcaligenaceae bacterium]